MEFLDRVTKCINRVMVLIAGIVLVGMILLTCANIVMRIVHVPIRGTFELMGMFGAIVTAFSLGYTLHKKGHISVDILFHFFPAPVRAVLGAFNDLVCLVFFSIASRQIWKWATTLRDAGELTETLQIIYYPFTYGVAIGCGVLAFVCLTDCIRSVASLKRGAR